MDRFIMELCAKGADEFFNECMKPIFPEVKEYAEGRLSTTRAAWMHCYMIRTRALYDQILFYDHQFDRGD